MPNDNNTFSSIEEALQSGIIDRALAAAAAPGPRRRATAESATSSITNSATGSIGGRADNNSRGRRRQTTSQFSQSFTAGFNTSANRIHTADTRSTFPSSSSSSSLYDDDTTIITIEGICLSGSPPPEEIDLTEMTREDLKRLKRDDPFMYYSIPEEHLRSYYGLDEDDDGEDEEEERAAAAITARRLPVREGSSSRSSLLRASCPAGMLANADIARSQLTVARITSVAKRRRLSVESHHSSIICETMMRRFSELSELGNILEEYDTNNNNNNGEEEDLGLEESLMGLMLLNRDRGGGSDDDYDSDDEYY